MVDVKWKCLSAGALEELNKALLLRLRNSLDLIS